jgi:hypothetical protein
VRRVAGPCRDPAIRYGESTDPGVFRRPARRSRRWPARRGSPGTGRGRIPDRTALATSSTPTPTSLTFPPGTLGTRPTAGAEPRGQRDHPRRTAATRGRRRRPLRSRAVASIKETRGQYRSGIAWRSVMSVSGRDKEYCSPTANSRRPGNRTGSLHQKRATRPKHSRSTNSVARVRNAFIGMDIGWIARQYRKGE